MGLDYRIGYSFQSYLALAPHSIRYARLYNIAPSKSVADRRNASPDIKGRGRQHGTPVSWCLQTVGIWINYPGVIFSAQESLISLVAFLPRTSLHKLLPDGCQSAMTSPSEKHYRCTVCQRGFTRIDHLKRHQLRRK